MFNPFKFKCTPVVGIDINSAGVKLVEISAHHGTHQIEGFFKESLPQGVIEGHTIKNSQAVTECVARAVEKGRIHGKQAIVAVPDAAVITKTILINTGLSEREIEEFIFLESENYAPYSSDEINVDFQIMDPSLSNSAMHEVHVFVSRSEKVNERVIAVNRAGLEVKVVDIESFAMQRSAQLLIKESFNGMRGKGQFDTMVALIDIGVIEIRLVVLQGTHVIFTREEEWDPQPLIFALRQQSSEELACDKSAVWNEATHLQALMDGLLLQIKRLLQFFFSTSQHQSIDAIILAGEMAGLPRLLPVVQEKMGIVRSIANPYSSLNVNKNLDYQLLLDLSPSMMLACGLALRRL